MMKKCLLALGVWSLACSPAFAWWNTGHMITAQIALDGLKPEVRKEAERLIETLNPMEPHPGRRHFVPASVWMDDLKSRGLDSFNRWHYINIPFNADGLATVPSASDENIVTTMQAMTSTLQNERASDFEKALALRVLLHLFGDIHQPFHAVGRISEQFPDGDWGGSRSPIQGVEGIKNIHAFWDSTAGRFPAIATEDWQAKIPGFAAELERAYPRLSFATQMPFDPEHWARESHHLAVNEGYLALPVNGMISAEYTRNARAIIERRLALGGYRLADFLNENLHR